MVASGIHQFRWKAGIRFRPTAALTVRKWLPVIGAYIKYLAQMQQPEKQLGAESTHQTEHHAQEYETRRLVESQQPVHGGDLLFRNPSASS